MSLRAEPTPTVLLEAVGLLSGPYEFPQVLERFAALFRARLNADVVEVWLRERESGVFRLVGRAGAGDVSGHDPARSATPEGVLQRLIAGREPGSLAPWAGAPLVVDGQAVGAVLLRFRDQRALTEEEQALVEALATIAAVAIRNARLHEEQARRTAEALSETEKRLHQTESHLEIARTLSSTLELKPRLKEIARQAARACEMDRCSIYLLEDDRVVPVMSQYADGRDSRALWASFKGLGRMRVEEVPFLADTVRGRAPIVIDRPEEDVRVPRALGVFQIKTMLILPLVRQDTVVGAMILDNTDQRRPVTPAQTTLATTIASQVALALDNARLYDETQRRLRETAALLTVAQSLGGSLNPQEIARRTAREIARLLGADTAIFFGADETNEHLIGVAGYHVPEPVQDPNILVPMRDLPAYVVAARESGRPLFTSDVATDPMWADPVTQNMVQVPTTMLCAPVLSQGRLLGALLGYWWTEHRQLTDEELSLAAGAAAQMAPVLENARLYAQAQRALAELKATQERLVQAEKVRAMAEMAGGVAHDFNNLLAAILGRTQYLMLRLDKGVVSPEDARRDLAVIERAAVDGAETVRRLLDFTRARGPGETATVDVNELLSYTVEVSRHRWKDEAEARGQRVEVALKPGKVPPVAGSASELREVLLNLVFNAIDAMPEGGTLTLSSRAKGKWVSLQVRDTGIGMSEEVKRRVFDPFFTTKGPRSSGLGLSASYGIVRSHGGEIEAESVPGQGTTFTVRLPLTDLSLPPAPPAPAAATPRALRVLVIDDEEPVRAVLRDLFAEAGHTVWEAESGPAGLALLDRQPVDLVVTDLGMPGMTGWEVATRVKARWPERKVALVTGWGAQVKPEELKEHGVDMLFAKPVKIADILSISL